MSNFVYVFSMVLFESKNAPLTAVFENPATIEQIIEGIADVSEKFNTTYMRESLGVELADMYKPFEWDAALDAAMESNGWASFQKLSGDETALFSVQRLHLS